jgi:hypothetical protein
MADASEQKKAEQELRIASDEAVDLITVLRDWCQAGMAHYHECDRVLFRLEAALNRVHGCRRESG